MESQAANKLESTGLLSSRGQLAKRFYSAALNHFFDTIEVIEAAKMYMIVGALIQTCCSHCFKLYLLCFYTINVHIIFSPSISQHGCLCLYVGWVFANFFDHDDFLPSDHQNFLCIVLAMVIYNGHLYRTMKSIYKTYLNDTAENLNAVQYS